MYSAGGGPEAGFVPRVAARRGVPVARRMALGDAKDDWRTLVHVERQSPVVTRGPVTRS